jgi:hypothetical protein
MGQVIGWYWVEETVDGEKKVTCVMDDGRLSSRCSVKVLLTNVEPAVIRANREAKDDLDRLRRAVVKLEKEE